MHRYNESSRVLSLVATHSRDRLVVTALALSPRPLVASVGGCEQEEHSVSSVPLVALADRTTQTVAVLALPCFNSRISATHTPISGGADSGTGGRGGDGSGDEEMVDAVRHLRLISVWPCREKVTSLVASGKANAVDYDGKEDEDDRRGEDQQQHWRRQHVVSEASRFAGDSERNGAGMFLMGTASGAVWTVAVETPNSLMKSSALLETSQVDPER